ncbi:hypothetical protein D4764_09G0001470 [Takifugu flavidus]|uniref:Uncharacterized protein n=1 Tax=Takifugu flavidus TaxID=433684 RepID=A0A5C6MKL5_9TELE|nr:hypothetical protein D4764_09G0001470 [Takifugu flavidus]
MLYNVLLSVTVFLFCLSLLLVYRVTVLENDIHNLRRDINPPLNLQRTEQVGGKMAKMSKPREMKSCAAQNAHSPLKMFFKRLKRDQGSSRAVASFLQLTASSIKQLETKGVVQLHQGDELELVIPFRPQALISMDADSTFFGVIQLN